VLRNREGNDAADSPAPPVVATTARPAITSPAAEVRTVPTTGLQAPTTLPEPPAAPAPTSPPARPGPGSDRVTATTAPATRFGPVCGYAPGQTVVISINGRRAPPVTAGADGCVSVRR
jgi:hypothetical protein